MTATIKEWTDERVEELRRRWDTTESAAEIAAAMGTTRCAVLGKAHRLNLTSRREAPREIRARSASPRPRRLKKVVPARTILFVGNGEIVHIKPVEARKPPPLQEGVSRTSAKYRALFGSLPEMSVKQRREMLAEVMRNTAALPIEEAS